MEVNNCSRDSALHRFKFTIIEHPGDTNARMSVTLSRPVSFCFASDRIGKPKSTDPFLTRELRACARASYRYDVGNGIRSIGRFL